MCVGPQSNENSPERCCKKERRKFWGVGSNVKVWKVLVLVPEAGTKILLSNLFFWSILRSDLSSFVKEFHAKPNDAINGTKLLLLRITGNILRTITKKEIVWDFLCFLPILCQGGGLLWFKGPSASRRGREREGQAVTVRGRLR